MKKLSKLAGFLVGLLLGTGILYAANTCNRNDFWCYESGSTAGFTTQARLDSNGNLTLNGNESVTGNQTTIGNTYLSPSFQSAISTMVPVTPTGSYVLIESTGGQVTFGSSSSFPFISTAGVTNGQYIVLYDTSVASTITITPSSATAIVSSSATITFASTMSAHGFIFNSNQSEWIDMGNR